MCLCEGIGHKYAMVWVWTSEDNLGESILALDLVEARSLLRRSIFQASWFPASSFSASHWPVGVLG